MKRKRYTYIPKDEIAEITTFNDVTFENDAILDGAYVRGRKKYARGGFTGDSLEKQALQAVGIDSWFNMEESDRQGLIEELASSGIISEVGMMADGGYMANGGLFSNLFSNKIKVGDVLMINPYNLPPMRNGSQYFNVLPSTKLKVEKISNRYFIRRIGIDDMDTIKTEDLNEYNKKDIDTFLKEGRLIKIDKMVDGGVMAKGGDIAKKGQVKIGDSIYKVFYNDSDGEEFTVPIYANSEKEAISKFENKYPHIEYVKFAKKINTSTNYDIFEEMREYASGGMMDTFKNNSDDYVVTIIFSSDNVRKGWATNDSIDINVNAKDYNTAEIKALQEFKKLYPNKKGIVTSVNNSTNTGLDNLRLADGGMMADGGEIKTLWKVEGNKATKLKTGTQRAINQYITKNKLDSRPKGENWGLESWNADATEQEVLKYDRDWYADGGVATAATYMVKYHMKDAPKEIKEKLFTDKDKAELFYETLQEEDDIVVMPIVEVKPEVKAEAKPKSLFASAKPAPATAAAKKKRDRVQVDGIEDDIRRYDELKAVINNAEAEKEIIGGKLKEIGRDKFLDIYEDTGRRPANFDLADGNENILLEVTDKYLKVEPEKAAILEKYDGLLEVVTTYEFNKDVLEKKVSDDMTVGDVVSMLIQDSKLLSDSDKENLIKAKTTMRVPKGTLDRLMDYDNPREVFNLIAPVLALK